MKIYEEVQDRHPLWVRVVVWGTVILTWGTLLWDVTFGTGEMPGPLRWIVLILVGVMLPGFFEVSKLIVTVKADGVRVRYVPLVDRTYNYSQVVSATATKYRPIRDYGGWGIRVRPGRRAYSIGGWRGVELKLADGDTVILGSRDPEPLATAIRGQL